MALPINPRIALAAGALALGLGWLLGGGNNEVGNVVQPRRDAWSLPELPRKPDLASTGLALANAPLFEPEAPAVAAAGASAAPPAPVDQRWRIAGVFPQGRSRVVLISFMAPGKEPQRLQVGDKLPSGHRIQRIEDNQVCVQIGSKTYRMGVEYRDE